MASSAGLTPRAAESHAGGAFSGGGRMGGYHSPIAEGTGGSAAMLEIKTREHGRLTVLDLYGCLSTGLGLEALRPYIEKLVAEKRLNLVLNAKDVSVIDSHGVGELVASFSLIKRSGGTLKVANPSQIVRDVLQITKLPKIIEVHDTEAAALESFAK
jgi:anti-sigma B factor antagonist